MSEASSIWLVWPVCEVADCHLVIVQLLLEHWQTAKAGYVGWMADAGWLQTLGVLAGSLTLAKFSGSLLDAG